MYLFAVAPYNVTISADFNGDIVTRPAVVEYGDFLILNCTTSVGLDNMYQWFKDDILLQENTDILNITAVSAADGGLYDCVVNNTAGISYDKITIYGMELFYQSIQHVYYNIFV